MTAQIGDYYLYKGTRYSIVAISKEIGFAPSQYGIIPEMKCTLCWKGYWCGYVITDDGLLLENLYTNSQGGHYPTINGINATVPKRKEHNTYDYIAADTHHHKYSGLKIPICFTGKILLGNGSISKYCINMGYQQYWVYKELKEFVFNSGKLVEINDYSQMAETARNKSDDLRKHLCDPEKFVEDSFFLDYDVKAWWIKR